jgi:ParB/RepB/Spo0J family partition protein
MGLSLDHSGRTAIQGEPGTGKTRLAVATAARQAYHWRHRNTALFQRGQSQPAWVRGLRRAWLKNPRTLAMLGLTPVRDAASGRITAYRQNDGKLLPPEEAGPRALPVLVSTPKKVTKEYAAEVRAAWPEAEVVFIDRHSDIQSWMKRCAESSAPAVIAILSHSLTRAFGREWHPVVREKQFTRREPILEPVQELLPKLEPIYNEQEVLTGYRWKATGKFYAREETVTHFYCPGCGGQIKATPGKLHEREQRSDEEEQHLSVLKKGQQEEETIQEDSLEPVTSKTWFTLKPRWCRCRMDARNQPGPSNPEGRLRVRTPLWTDARLETTQRKHPQLPFASWSVALHRLYRQNGHNGMADKAIAADRSVGKATGKNKAISLGFTCTTGKGQGIQNHGDPCYVERSPLPESFSPYDCLYRFFRGCVALAVIDESHNGRGCDTDTAHSHHQAMLASQTRMLTSGTHFGGDILGFYHYWFRYHPQFWRRLGLSWNDADKALSRYGVIQEWTKEFESDARRGSGQTTVQVSTIPAPGLSAKLIPYLLEDMVYLTVLDVGAHMPPRREIPEIVPMRDGEIVAALDEAERTRKEATRQITAYKQAHLHNHNGHDLNAQQELARLQQAVEEASEQERVVQAWAEPRHLAAHYGQLVHALDDLARKRNTAARLAKGTVPRWFAVLPCDRPFEVWETRRDRWGDTLGRAMLVQTEQLVWEHIYPLERRLITLVQRELGEGRRVMLYIDQNDVRSTSRRLEWVLKDMQPWTLPNSVAAEDRQQAILQAVQRGHHVVIVPYRRVNEGLNLQSAIDTILWVEMALNLFMLDQASRRAWRLGKRKEVRIYYLAYANTAGHTKLRKLGQQSGAAAAFAGEPARGALIEHAGADKTTLARLSSLLDQSEGDEDEENVVLQLSGEQEVAQEEAVLKDVFARRAEELHKALLRGREWLGGIKDDLAERLTVLTSCDQLVRSAKRLVKSIQHVGILQNPSVVVQGGRDMHDEEATFEVIAGRRRVLAARFAGLPVVKCEVYAASTLPLSALLALVENEQRSAAWIREVEALRCLIDEGVGMTLDDLAAFGFDRATLTERLKIAQLPVPLLNSVLAGRINREVARKLVRLTQVQQERVASLTLAGEDITAERVKDLLRAQINTGLVPVQNALAQGWNNTSPVPTQPGNDEQAGKVEDVDAETALAICTNTSISSLSTLLAALQAFEHGPEYRTVPQPIQTLTLALAQQVQLALHDVLPVLQSQTTLQSQFAHKGANNNDRF